MRGSQHLVGSGKTVASRSPSLRALERGLSNRRNLLRRIVLYSFCASGLGPVVSPLAGQQPAHALLGLGQWRDAGLGAQQGLELLVFRERRAPLAKAHQAFDHRETRGLAVLVELGRAPEAVERGLEPGLTRVEPAQLEQ